MKELIWCSYVGQEKKPNKVKGTYSIWSERNTNKITEIGVLQIPLASAINVAYQMMILKHLMTHLRHIKPACI